MHVESVAWAAERKDVLSVFFGLLTLWAYLRYAEKPGGRRYLALAAAFLLSLLSKPMLVTLPFVLLLLDYWPLKRLKFEIRNLKFETNSKFEIPNSIRVGEAPSGWFRSSDFFRVLNLFRISNFEFRIWEKVPLFALAAAAGAVTLLTLDQSDAVVSWSVLPLSARLANALSAYGWYLAITFWPWNLAVLYPHPYGNWSLLSALAGAGAMLALTLLGLWQARRRPWLIVGWLWFAIALLPVIGLAQSGEQVWADRFSYWPHIGLFVAVAWSLGELAERWRIPAPVCGAAAALGLGGLAVLTGFQVACWRNTAVLWEHALAVTRDNDVAHLHLGYYRLHQGRPDEAVAHFAEAVRIRPDVAAFRYSLGAVLLSLGRVDEAAGHLEQIVGQAPGHSEAWYNLGMARLRQHRPQEAADCFRKVLDLRPESADAVTALGLALWQEGERPEAVDAFQAALRRDPQQAEAWHGLGVAHLAQGRLDEATEAFDKALRSNPQLVKAYSDLGTAFARRRHWDTAVRYHATAVRVQEQGGDLLEKMTGPVPAPDSVPDIVTFRCRLAFALHELGNRQAAEQAYRAALQRDPGWPGKYTAKAWRLATHPDANLRDPRLAYELASQAVQGTGDPSASLLDALAAAQAALGRFPEAVQTAQQALKKASAAGDPALARSIRDHLQLYEKGEPVTARPPQG
jgi:tetratricopeptide (TPR) repeat protein